MTSALGEVTLPHREHKLIFLLSTQQWVHTYHLGVPTTHGRLMHESNSRLVEGEVHR